MPQDNAREIRPAAAEDSGFGVAPKAWSTDHHVHRWQAGDEAAFETLYLRFAPLLARRVRRNRSWHLLKKRQQVEDVVQAVWQRVIPAARRVFTPSGPGSFLAYLGTVADRTMIDLARWQGAAKRGEGVREEDLEAALVRSGNGAARLAAAETPTSHARASEIRELAARVLNERELEVWELVESDGYELEEVALALECSASAARGVYFRARRKLIQALATPGEAQGEPRGGDCAIPKL